MRGCDAETKRHVGWTQVVLQPRGSQCPTGRTSDPQGRVNDNSEGQSVHVGATPSPTQGAQGLVL